MDRLAHKKHEKYATLRAQGEDRTLAYARAYGRADLESACRLERRDDVRARISTLKLLLTASPASGLPAVEDPEPPVDIQLDASTASGDVSDSPVQLADSRPTLLEHIARHRGMALQEMSNMAMVAVAMEDVQPRDKIQALRAWLAELREMETECRRQMAEQGDEVAAGFYDDDAMQAKAAKMVLEELRRVRDGECTVDELIAECERELGDEEL
uniref:Uncharacterized protein n=1 Tax=viral metagenome TaxID=1070528 RepID=A0A6M3KUY8_9ZZZZ